MAGNSIWKAAAGEIAKSRLVDFLRQVTQALAAKSVAFFRIIAHGQDCHHPRIDVSASMANQQPPVGTNLEPALGNGDWILDKFDFYKIAFSLQRLSHGLTRYGFGAAIHD